VIRGAGGRRQRTAGARRVRTAAGALLAAFGAAVLAYAASFAVEVRYAGRASLVVPQSRPGQAASLAQLAAAALPQAPSQADLFVAVMQSRLVTQRLVERFDLQRAWGLRFRTQVEAELARRVRFTIGRRDGVLRIEVEDALPHRAAAIANQYVLELLAVLEGFAREEARQKRELVESQWRDAMASLGSAQQAAQRAGLDGATLRVEPRSALDAYGRAAAEVAAAEATLDALRTRRSESSLEVRDQAARLAALRRQLEGLERAAPGRAEPAERWRELRLREAIAEALARQLAAARAEEAAPLPPVHRLDVAAPAELPVRPRRVLWVLVAGGAGAAAALALAWWRGRPPDPDEPAR
jgi:uncharacterized protein involved in exopolysaccharide biosynthesis